MREPKWIASVLVLCLSLTLIGGRSVQSFLERVYGVVTACDEASAEQIALSVQTMQVRLELIPPESFARSDLVGVWLRMGLQAVMREQNLQCQRVFITSSRSGRGVRASSRLPIHPL